MFFMNFMEKFDHEARTVPLDEMLMALPVSNQHINGMDFVLLDYYRRTTEYSDSLYILFREIVNDQVLEPAYVVIPYNHFDGVKGYDKREMYCFIGDHMRIYRDISHAVDDQTHYYLEAVEWFDYKTKHLIGYLGCD